MEGSNGNFEKNNHGDTESTEIHRVIFSVNLGVLRVSVVRTSANVVPMLIKTGRVITI